MPDTSPSAGLRERNMRDKQERIFRSAAGLFSDHGFESVSTNEIAKKAGVASGTVFRYAATKGELLLMVLNKELGQAIAAGAQRATSLPDTSAAITAMIVPILEYAVAHPENGRTYQRELLFGDPSDRYRAEGLALVLKLQNTIAERLMADAEKAGLQPDPNAALLVGNMIFGVVHLTLARPSTGAHPDRDPVTDIRNQIDAATAGYLHRLPPISPTKGS